MHAFLSLGLTCCSRIVQKSLLLTVLVLSGMNLVPGTTAAQQPALDFASLGTGYNFNQGSYSLGWKFSTNQNVTVTALGFYDDLMNGLSGNHAVGIFDAQTCQLLASTTVLPSDPLTGFFRYHDISPVNLPGGRDYYAAAVTGGESYAVSVTDLIVDPAIDFLGFAIYGNTVPTSNLLCPNGPAGQVGFHGDFGPSFKIDSQGGGSGKRGTAISLFCNRTGVNLNTARCSVTVADKGAPPRSLPTGAVEFFATDGFFPGTASCLLQQTQFSPGIASCEVQFAVPDGFGIGIPFPIEALYGGNDDFEASATSHELINASCIGDADSPCSGAVSLGFANIPEILKNVLQLMVGCGGSSPQPATGAASQGRWAMLPGKKDPQQCDIQVVSTTRIAKALANLNAEAITDLGDILTGAGPQSEPEVAAVHELVHQVQQGKIDWSNLQGDEEALERAIERMIIRRPVVKPAVLPARRARPVLVKLGARSARVGINRQKVVPVRVPRGAAKLLRALKVVGVDELETSVVLKGKRTGKVPRGTKRKFSLTEVVTTGLNN